ncbi:MAG: thrombospondin type 3 repeat-containing protein, partial [Flavobacteriaceae bacterium]
MYTAIRTTFCCSPKLTVPLFALVLFFGQTLCAQTTIWSEDFNSYANGTITGAGTGTSPVNWNSQVGAAVSGGLILASDTRNVAGSTLANPLIWVTNPMDITGYVNVTFSLDVGAFNVANFEDGGGAQDNFTLTYRIDGGGWITVISASGSAAQPINPSYTIAGLSGSTLEIRTSFHNTASNENYTIDNVLVQGTLATTDSDGDGVPDQTDLDNDNDGIPDLNELNTVASNSQPPCGGETVLDFSTPAVLVSGTPLTQGAVYRIANITAGTDALVTIVTTNNATVANIDNNTADP